MEKKTGQIVMDDRVFESFFTGVFPTAGLPMVTASVGHRFFFFSMP